MDDWDMYDDDEGPVASGSGSKRNHVVFTDSIEAGEFHHQSDKCLRI